MFCRYEYDMDYDQEDKLMQTQLNISWFDNLGNESRIEQAEITPIKQQPSSTGAFSMLRERLKENASKEKDKQIKKEVEISEATRKNEGELSKRIFFNFSRNWAKRRESNPTRSYTSEK